VNRAAHQRTRATITWKAVIDFSGGQEPLGTNPHPNIYFFWPRAFIIESGRHDAGGPGCYKEHTKCIQRAAVTHSRARIIKHAAREDTRFELSTPVSWKSSRRDAAAAAATERALMCVSERVSQEEEREREKKRCACALLGSQMKFFLPRCTPGQIYGSVRNKMNS